MTGSGAVAAMELHVWLCVVRLSVRGRAVTVFEMCDGVGCAVRRLSV